MAEGASADNPSINRKPATDYVWDIKLFQNLVYASNLACIECGHPPKKCFMDKDHQTFCEQCSKPLLEKGDKINPNPFADGVISKAEIVCKNVLYDPSEVDDEKQEEPKQCEWKGLVKDWKNHNDKECQFTVVNCDDCCEYSSSRSLQSAHHEKCDFATIKCPLKCNGDILRKDTEKHTKNECPKTILKCTNDECKEEIVRELYNEHVTQQCPKRIVQCEYSEFGCTQPNVKYESMETHLQQFETKHLQFQLNSLYQLINQKRTSQQGMDCEAGMIQMFGGSIIPKGWILCDGTNGTPDLRDKFMTKSGMRKYQNNTPNINGNEDADDFEISEIEDNNDDDYDDDDYDDNQNDDITPCYSMIYIMKA